MDPQTFAYTAPVVEHSSSAGTWALVLVIIVIIFLIVLAILFFRESSIVSGLVNYWTEVQGGTGITDSFTASPNAIYLASVTPATLAVTVNQYPEISSVVTGNRGTEFKISNTARTIDLNVIAGTNVSFEPTTLPVSAPHPLVIGAGQTGTYLWTSTTTIRRLS